VTSEELRAALSEVVVSDDVIALLDEILDRARPDSIAKVRVAFEFLEQHPDAAFGNPGPVVHFIEECRGYEAELDASIARCPTPAGVTMLQRIFNAASTLAERQALLRRAAALASRDDVSAATKAATTFWLESEEESDGSLQDEEDDEVPARWRLHIHDEFLGELVQTDQDFPWVYCEFSPAPAWSAFEANLATRDKLLEKGHHAEAAEEFDALELTVEGVGGTRNKVHLVVEGSSARFQFRRRT
jgi:hypothetical protein